MTSSFEPTPLPWMEAASFVPTEAGRAAEFVPDAKPDGADTSGRQTAPGAGTAGASHDAGPSNEELLAAAHEAGRREGVAEAQLRLEPVLDALGDAAAKLAEQREEYLPAQHRLLIDLAVEIARTLIGRSVQVDVGPLMDRVGEAVSLVDAHQAVTVSLHPDDHESVTRALAAEPQREDVLTAGRKLTLVADATLAPGDASVSCGAVSVDARMQTMLERVRQALHAGEAPTGRDEGNAS